MTISRPAADRPARRAAHPPAREDPHAALDRRARDTVALDGYQVVAVPGGEGRPDLAYTVGLVGTWHHAEIAVVGLAPEWGTRLLHLIAEDVAGGLTYTPAGRYGGVLARGEVAFRAIPPALAARHLRLAARFVAPAPLAALQCLWPDRDGRLPDDAGCDRDLLDSQPFLDDLPDPS